MSDEIAYDIIQTCLIDAEQAIEDAIAGTSQIAGDFEGTYEGMDETTRRLQALLEKFKVDVKFALEPIAKDIEAYNAQQSEMEDMAEASRL